MALRSIAFLAQFTAKRFRSRVNAMMLIQFRPRREHLATIGANEFFDAVVTYLMISQCYLSFEFLPAFGTLERGVCWMRDQVALKTVGSHEWFATEIAHVSTNIFMHFPVKGQRCLVFEHFIAFAAFELLDVGVFHTMAAQSTRIIEFFVAFGTHRLFSRMHSWMRRQLIGTTEFLVTLRTVEVAFTSFNVTYVISRMDIAPIDGQGAANINFKIVFVIGNWFYHFFPSSIQRTIFQFQSLLERFLWFFTSLLKRLPGTAFAYTFIADVRR